MEEAVSATVSRVANGGCLQYPNSASREANPTNPAVIQGNQSNPRWSCFSLGAGREYLDWYHLKRVLWLEPLPQLIVSSAALGEARWCVRLTCSPA